MTSTEIAAWWGAIVATFVALLELYKWKSSGPKLKVTISPNMVGFGGFKTDNEKVVLIEVANIGNFPTTITATGLRGFKFPLLKYLKNTSSLHVLVLKPVNETNKLPFQIKPGEIWSATTIQDSDLTKLSGNGRLYLEVHDSWNKKPTYQLIKL